MSARRIALVAILAAAIGTADAHAADAPQELVSPGAQPLPWVGAGFQDESAVALAVLGPWRGHRRLVLFERRSGEPFGAARTLADGEELAFESYAGPSGRLGLASNPAGVAAVAWSEAGMVHATVRDPIDGFGRVQRLGQVPVRSGTVVTWVSSRGDAVAMWSSLGGDLQAALQPAGETRFGPAVDLGHAKNLYRVAVGEGAGGVVLAWEACARTDAPGSGCSEAIRATRSRGTGFERPQTLGPVDGSDARVSAHVGPHGDALVIWSGARRGSVRAARRARASDRFGRAQVLSDRRRIAHSVAAASRASGGVAAWIERRRDGRVQVVGTTIDARLRTGARFPLSAPVARAAVPKVLVQDDGAAAVWWRRVRERSGFDTWSIRSRAAGGAFSPAAELYGQRSGATVALDGHGDVLALMTAQVAELGPGCSDYRVLLAAAWRAGQQPDPVQLDCSGAFGTLVVAASGRAWVALTRSTVSEAGQTSFERWVSNRNGDGGQFGSARRVGSGDAWAAQRASEFPLGDDGDALVLFERRDEGGLYAAFMEP